jgi:hypothetical protein
LKEADAGPTQQFPIHANTLRDELVAIVKLVKLKFPNCNIVYLSSRTYGGYATTTLNPEPYAYESGFSVKWVIEKQINEDTTLACTGDNQKAPWLAWGPYLWADGLSPRSDGLLWDITDFVSTDGTHPSTSGRQKVAAALINYLKSDSTARMWFLNYSSSRVNITSTHRTQTAFNLFQNYPNPFNPETTIRYSLPFSSKVSLTIYNVLGQIIIDLVNTQQDAGFKEVKWNADASTGVYYYRIEATSNSDPQNRFVQVKKMNLMR